MKTINNIIEYVSRVKTLVLANKGLSLGIAAFAALAIVGGVYVYSSYSTSEVKQTKNFGKPLFERISEEVSKLSTVQKCGLFLGIPGLTGLYKVLNNRKAFDAGYRVVRYTVFPTRTEAVLFSTISKLGLFVLSTTAFIWFIEQNQPVTLQKDDAAFVPSKSARQLTKKNVQFEWKDDLSAPPSDTQRPFSIPSMPSGPLSTVNEDNKSPPMDSPKEEPPAATHASPCASVKSEDPTNVGTGLFGAIRQNVATVVYKEFYPTQFEKNWDQKFGTTRKYCVRFWAGIQRIVPFIAHKACASVTIVETLFIESCRSLSVMISKHTLMLGIAVVSARLVTHFEIPYVYAACCMVWNFVEKVFSYGRPVWRLLSKCFCALRIETLEDVYIGNKLVLTRTIESNVVLHPFVSLTER